MTQEPLVTEEMAQEAWDAETGPDCSWNSWSGLQDGGAGGQSRVLAFANRIARAVLERETPRIQREAAREALTEVAQVLATRSGEVRHGIRGIENFRDQKYPLPERRSRVVTTQFDLSYQFHDKTLFALIGDTWKPVIRSVAEEIGEYAATGRYADAALLAGLAAEHFGGADGR